MRTISATCLVGLLMLGLVPVAQGSAESDIHTANAAGKAVFLVVTQTDASGAQVSGTDRTLAIARQASQAAPGSTVVVLDRAVAENAPLVKAYGLLGAPVPLILVVASNGVIAGGARLRDANAQLLVKMIPTPKKAELLLAGTQKKAVFLVVSRKTMPNQGPAFEAVSEAFRQMRKTSSVITVDLDDKKEAAFLAELKIDKRVTEPVLIVWNQKAQKTAKFDRVVTARQLIEAVNKKVACCPPGGC